MSVALDDIEARPMLDDPEADGVRSRLGNGAGDCADAQRYQDCGEDHDGYATLPGHLDSRVSWNERAAYQIGGPVAPARLAQVPVADTAPRAVLTAWSRYGRRFL